MVRVAVLDEDRCKSKRCGRVCYRFCPPVRSRIEAIRFENAKPLIVEALCVGCGICLDPSVPIFTEDGVRLLSDIKMGDRVLTHNGEFMPVREVHRRRYDGPLYEISIYGLPDKLLVTKEHPILAVVRKPIKRGRRLKKAISEKKWVLPNELKKGDYLLIPIMKGTRDVLTLTTKIPVVIPGGEGNVWVEKRFHFKTDGNFLRLIGYYLAEGIIERRRITLTFSSREQRYINDSKYLIGKYLRGKPTTYNSPRNSVQVRLNSSPHARFFSIFGASCDLKKVPSWALTIPQDKQSELVKGVWRGDGCREKKRNYFNIVTTSKTLAYQLQQILARGGIVGSIAKSKQRSKKTAYHINVLGGFVQKMAEICGVKITETRNRTCSRFIIDGNHIYAPIRRIKIRRVSGHEVLNLEVERDETYVASGVVVHNCVKKCPFKALSIVNLADELEGECSHRFGPNTFKLFRLPIPSSGVVLGLLGQNGIGKTTALKILSGDVKPNLGKYDEKPDWPQLIQHFRGSTLQEYFQRLSANRLRMVHKPQYVDKIPRVVLGKVGELLEKIDERGKLGFLVEQLQLHTILDRKLDVLSGGELQRVAIAATICREADVYLFDEPSSYLDVKQRLQAARAIRSLKNDGKTVVVAEHDLAILDYLSDHVCVFYGAPGVYGIVSHVHGVRVGINIYLQGFIPDENVRFRKDPIIFHVKPPAAGWAAGETLLKWDGMKKSYGDFTLYVESGEAKRGEVIGIVGPNGIGKTTFVKLLAGIEKPDEGESSARYGLTIGYKPQYISAEYEGTVKDLLRGIAKDDFASSWYRSEVLQPLNVQPILDRDITELSGGELQKTAIAACLSQKAQLYLLDEPSAYLDVEERLSMARTIRRVVENRNVTAFVVEHDVVAQDFIADRLMIFTGEPGIRGVANPPTSLRNGMNTFLKEMNITFRRDPATKRPRVNKEESKLDRYQKKIAEYYYVPAKEK
ncbi:MAG: Trehalose/maltose import ATP-binding protein MalK [Candidatus Bathyarchaeota archaeon BA1]|nr:MAG: Trehalose/maltose import ATP-binding protein MalK [Candidatus Bathyarchaeota archaeon BA1]